VQEICRTAEPPLKSIKDTGRLVACHLVDAQGNGSIRPGGLPASETNMTLEGDGASVLSATSRPARDC
jgi:hypothetical protein